MICIYIYIYKMCVYIYIYMYYTYSIHVDECNQTDTHISRTRKHRQEAARWLGRMRGMAVAPDAASYNVVIGGLARSQRSEEAPSWRVAEC